MCVCVEYDMFNYSGGVRVGVVRWNACHLPIRTASVDVIVTDMVRVCKGKDRDGGEAR